MTLRSSIVVFLLLFHEFSAEPPYRRIYDEMEMKGKPIVEKCDTEGCLKTAERFRNSWDLSVDPCDNFYKFACGGYVRKTVIPDEKILINAINSLDDELNYNIKNLLEQSKLPKEEKLYWMMQQFHDTCMNEDAIEKAGSQPMLDLLRRLGGWPVVEGKTWNKRPLDWQHLHVRFREEGVKIDSLFSIEVFADLKNAGVHLIQLDQPDFGMPDRSFLLKGFHNSIVQSYYHTMTTTAIMLGANKKAARREMKEVLQFEMNLANFSMSKAQRRNHAKLYNKIKLMSLHRITNKVNWLEYLSTMAKQTLDNQEAVIVYNPIYLSKAFRLIEETPQRIVANYLIWRIVLAQLSYLDKSFRTVKLKYESKFTGKLKSENRTIFCIKHIKKRLPLILSHYYVRTYFNPASKIAAAEMVNAIQNEFDLSLKKVKWMDPITKKRTREKLKAIRKYIGYPDELLDEEKLNDYHNGLNMTNNRFFQNILNIKKFILNQEFLLLKQSPDEMSWVGHSKVADVNAMYLPLENALEINAGILQSIFFQSDRPWYLNYGAIGYVIAHEFMHGFDDQGHLYDKNGNLRDWWLPKTDRMFKDKVKCFVYQYGNYSVGGLSLNGIVTQGENIADNGGVKQAYRAYVRWSRKNEPEKTLPSLPFTQRQMFWISAANIWCETSRTEALIYQIMIGAHSPGEFRINGVLSNLPEFAYDFRCPKGSLMNPEEKCSLW